MSSRAPDLLFHQKIREGKFVGDQTNTNTLEETVGEAGEIVGLNKVASESSLTRRVVFPRSSHPLDPQTLPRHHQPGKDQQGPGVGNKAPNVSRTRLLSQRVFCKRQRGTTLPTPRPGAHLSQDLWMR